MSTLSVSQGELLEISRISGQGDPGPASLGDQLLEEYIRTGSQNAFRQIVLRHGEMVIRVCLRSLAHVQDAEDAAQVVFLHLARQPERARGSLGGWLHKVAQHTAIKMLQS